MASRLGAAARRLGQQHLRGLAGALTDGAAASSSSTRQQPMSALGLRTECSSSGGGGGLPAAAAAASRDAEAAGPGPSAGATAPSQPAQQQQQAQQAQQQQEGAVDFARKELVMFFTCNKCNTRAAKAFSKKAYTTGVVIVDCPGCHSKHLIADNLGWFGQKGTVEEFAAEKGNMVVRKLADGTTELSPEDIMGHSPAAGQEAGGQSEAAAAALGAGGGQQ